MKTKWWNGLCLTALTVMTSVSSAALANGFGGGGLCEPECCEPVGQPECCSDDRINLFIQPLGSYTTLKVGNDTEGRRDFNGGVGGVAAGIDFNTRFLGLYSATYGYWQMGSLSRSSNEDGVTFLDHDRDYSEWELEQRVGWRHCFNLWCHQWQVSLYSGSGYLEQSIGHIFETYTGVTGTVSGNTELTYRMWYIPVGVDLVFNWNDCMTAGLNFKWSGQIDSTVETSVLTDYRIAMKNRSGYDVEIPLIYKWNCGCTDWDIGIVPFWSYKAFGEIKRDLDTEILAFDGNTDADLDITGTWDNVRIASGGLGNQTYNSWGGKLHIGVRF